MTGIAATPDNQIPEEVRDQILYPHIKTLRHFHTLTHAPLATGGSQDGQRDQENPRHLQSDV